MLQDQIKQLAKSLHKYKFLIAKPSTDVFVACQAFVLLVNGAKIKDWLLLQQLMSCSFPSMIDALLAKQVEASNVIQCKKILQSVPSTQTLLGKQLVYLIQTALNYLDQELIKFKRSKSSILPRRIPQESSHQKGPSKTRIGNLVKSYKEDIQRMINSRKSLKQNFVQERVNRNVEELKQKMKKINKNCYFLSPRKEQHDQCYSQEERKPLSSAHHPSLKQLRKSQGLP